MTIRISRRRLLAASLLTVPAVAIFPVSAQPPQPGQAIEARLAELERAHGGRLGVAMMNVATGRQAGHRADERFLLTSTAKVLAAALVLSRVERGEERLDRRVVYSHQDLVTWSPVTEHHVGGSGMTVAALCEAAITQSDNTAGNLLLASFGGPSALTAHARSLGDDVTRFDRIEPDLNEHEHAGDERDTTTPAAMSKNFHELFVGEALSKASRAQLAAWLIANKTGDARLRAGLPASWLVGDKTGTNGSGTSNDIAIAWPMDRGAVIVMAYCDMPSVSVEARNGIIAEVGRIAAQV
ncbi:class A beta-lactamase [Halomonas shantousis]